ncbi:hypothetical protein J4408_04160 [Candidatus Pacearchaeota archaeon]|nr:hypothetical protein [Candidatus Pacearchaeota archaeon]
MAKVKADLHNHLRTSCRFSDSDFNRTIDIAKRYEYFVNLKGYDRVYVGEKDNGIYVQKRNVLVIKGQEVPTKEGHVLVFGLAKDTHIKQNRSLADTLKESEDNNGIVVADHPFYRDGLGNYLEANPEYLKSIDAIEVHNGEAALGIPKSPFPYNANRKAQEFYNKLKEDFTHLGTLASSDGHSMYELGRSWTEIDSLDLEHKSEFSNSLRNSVRNTNSETPKRKKSSIFGALDHIIDLILITQIGFRVGLRDFYSGTD